MDNIRIFRSIKDNAVLRKLIVFMMLICSGIAICINPNGYIFDPGSNTMFGDLVSLFVSELAGMGVMHVIAVIAVGIFYHKRCFVNDNVSITSVVLGFIYSCFIITGQSFSALNSFDFIFGTKKQFCIAVIVFLGEWFLFYEGLKFIFEKIDAYTHNVADKKAEQIEKGKTGSFINKHFGLFCFVTILVAWIVFMLPFFPGSIPHDGRYQFNQFFGYTPMNTHHPYFATAIMGSIYSLGRDLFGYIGGCVFYVLFQAVIGAAVFSRVCVFAREKTGNKYIYSAILVFYAVTPMWWSYVQTLDKDAMHFIMFTLFVLQVIRIAFEDNKKIYEYIILFVAAVGCSMYRHDAKFIIIPALIIMVLCGKNIIHTVAASILITGTIFLSGFYVSNILNLESDSQVEAFSVPLQQTARLVRDHEDELTDEEKNTIDRIVDYDGIAERYNPDNADPVKDRDKTTMSQEEWDDFWELWLDKLQEHPETYISATVNNTYGYFYPFYHFTGLSTYQLYIKPPFNEEDKAGDYAVYSFDDDVRDVAYRLTYSWDKIPVISLLTGSGLYTFIFVFLIGDAIRRKKLRYLSMFLIPLLCIGVCIISPINGFIRYSLPIMAITPIYIVFYVSKIFSGVKDDVFGKNKKVK